MGHLTRIANTLQEQMEKGKNSDRLKRYFKGESYSNLPLTFLSFQMCCHWLSLDFNSEYPEDVQERWNSFVSSSLADTNKTNSLQIVSDQPTHQIVFMMHLLYVPALQCKVVNLLFLFYFNRLVIRLSTPGRVIRKIPISVICISHQSPVCSRYVSPQKNIIIFISEYFTKSIQFFLWS